VQGTYRFVYHVESVPILGRGDYSSACHHRSVLEVMWEGQGERTVNGGSNGCVVDRSRGGESSGRRKRRLFGSLSENMIKGINLKTC
jgi:hypothetical protein